MLRGHKKDHLVCKQDRKKTAVRNSQFYGFFKAITSHTNPVKMQWKWSLSNKNLLEFTLWPRANKKDGCHIHY